MRQRLQATAVNGGRPVFPDEHRGATIPLSGRVAPAGAGMWAVDTGGRDRQYDQVMAFRVYHELTPKSSPILYFGQ